jgi:hypothetical protein
MVHVSETRNLAPSVGVDSEVSGGVMLLSEVHELFVSFESSGSASVHGGQSHGVNLEGFHVSGVSSLGNDSVVFNLTLGASDLVVGRSEGVVGDSVGSAGSKPVLSVESVVFSVGSLGSSEVSQISLFVFSHFLGSIGLGFKGSVVSSGGGSTVEEGVLNSKLDLGELGVSLVPGLFGSGNSSGPVSGSSSGSEISTDLESSQVSGSSLESHVLGVLGLEGSPGSVRSEGMVEGNEVSFTSHGMVGVRGSGAGRA